MQFNRAGRGRKAGKKGTIITEIKNGNVTIRIEQKNVDDVPFTKEELRLMRNEKDGALSLARAVYKQWVLDGKPKQDEEAIRSIWLPVIEMYGDF